MQERKGTRVPVGESGGARERENEIETKSEQASESGSYREKVSGGTEGWRSRERERERERVSE